MAYGLFFAKTARRLSDSGNEVAMQQDFDPDIPIAGDDGGTRTAQPRAGSSDSEGGNHDWFFAKVWAVSQTPERRSEVVRKAAATRWSTT